MKRPRLMLADDNPLVLELVEQMLKKKFVITGTCTDGEDVLRDVPMLKPDVVILDISMSGRNGLEVAQELKDIRSPAKIVFLTVHEDLDFVRAAISVGAVGYVCKTSINEDLIEAIHSAMADKVFFPSLFNVERPVQGM